MTLVGKGIFVWQIAAVYGGDVARIAEEADRANLSHVVIKIADGRYKYNVVGGRDLVADLVAALRSRGVQPWGWQYIYGKNATAEADLAAQVVRHHNLAGFVVNAEGEFKAKGMAAVAEQYMQRLRKVLPSTQVALSSYRYPTGHYQFPFDAFLKHCDFSMPQVYWQGSVNPAQQLRKSFSEYRALRHVRPVVPTGSAYSFGDWSATPDQLRDFIDEAKSLGLSGVNFWEFGTSLRNSATLWKAIKTASWGSPPPVDDPPSVTGPVYVRFKHDKQWMKHPATNKPVLSRMDMPDWNPGFYLDVYPAVVPLSASPSGGDGNYKYSREWAKFLRASNPQTYTAIEKVAAGLFNPRATQQQPFPPNLDTYAGDTVAEGIGATGNIYQVIEERSNAVRVKLIDFQSAPPKPEQLNYEDTPWLMTAFSAVAKDGSVKKTAGRDLVYPNLGKTGGWVAKERVEFLPALPINLTVRDNLNIRNGPGLTHAIVGKLQPGNPIRVSEYAPRGSNVWGRIAADRWVALVHRTSNGSLYYYTTWMMETEPPLALVHPRQYLMPMVSPETDPVPNPSLSLVEKYFALLNSGNTRAVADLYTKTSAKLVAEGRQFAGQNAIYGWYQRFLNKKFAGAEFKIKKSEKQGSFYVVLWSADGENDVKNGKHLFRIEEKNPQLINYHYIEYSLT